MLGMLIGAEIDRDDGGSGLSGAVKGYLIEGAIKAIAPLIMTFALGWGVRLLARQAYEEVAGERSRP